MYNISNIRLEDNLTGIDMTKWEKRVCPMCGKVFYARIKYKKINCSEECQRLYIEEHKDEINKSKSKKLSEIYHSKTKEEIKKEHEKGRKTSLERYGYEKPQQSLEYRQMMSEKMKAKDWSNRTKKAITKVIDKINVLCYNMYVTRIDIWKSRKY